MKFYVKTKLIISFTLVVVMTGLIAVIVGTILISQGVMNQLRDKLRADLYSAREILNHRGQNIAKTLYFGAGRYSLQRALRSGNRVLLRQVLKEVREAGNISMLSITDNRGVVLMRSRNPNVFGDSQAHDMVIRRVLEEKREVNSVVVVPYNELIKEGEEFTRLAHIPINRMHKEERKAGEVISGLVIKAAAPVFGNRGELLGVLYGGDLLNRSYTLVDKIKNVVYQGEKYQGMDMGTATIFLGGVRISTNVVADDGRRAIGTRVSDEVNRTVIEKGKRYLGRAFVVNAWHVNAYEPIRDLEGRIIGMLGLGLLEKKFVDMKRKAQFILSALILVGMVLVLLVSNILANMITKPIRGLVAASKKISGGDFTTTVAVYTQDELGELEIAFNSMATALREREEELETERQRQLMRTEKLAALGRMAAGIAHEINNPLTGVLMYGHLLLDELPQDSQGREDAEIIVSETTRCRGIVRDLLDFSRESVSQKEMANINDILVKTISIIEKHVYFEKVEIAKELAEELPMIMVNVNEIEQVLINFTLNAAEAMSDGGTLTLKTIYNDATSSINIEVADTGYGIPEENIDKIFDPFFTTKEQEKGTGLGLAVSYGIIKRHGGSVDVKSTVGKGTTFIITLPHEIE